MDAACAVTAAAFGEVRAPGAVRLEARRRRVAHLARTDPDGAWVAEDGGGRLAGVALANVREGVRGLSLLVVAPGRQGRGVGRALLSRALGTARRTRGGIVLSSADPRAIGAYAGAGLRLVPALDAAGSPERAHLDAAPAVREGGPADLGLTADVDRRVRGAARPQDLASLLESPDARLLVHPRGYALVSPERVGTLAALDEDAARALLTTALAEAGSDAFQVRAITGAQAWAIEVVHAAGLSIRPGGPLCVRGELGPLAPYLPSGPYL